jgi:hypothetical protein
MQCAPRGRRHRLRQTRRVPPPAPRQRRRQWPRAAAPVVAATSDASRPRTAPPRSVPSPPRLESLLQRSCQTQRRRETRAAPRLQPRSSPRERQTRPERAPEPPRSGQEPSRVASPIAAQHDAAPCARCGVAHARDAPGKGAGARAGVRCAATSAAQQCQSLALLSFAMRTERAAPPWPAERSAPVPPWLERAAAAPPPPPRQQYAGWPQSAPVAPPAPSSPTSPARRRGLRPVPSAARQIPAFALDSGPEYSPPPSLGDASRAYPPSLPPVAARAPSYDTGAPAVPVARNSSRRSAVSSGSGRSSRPRRADETEEEREARRARRAERRALAASQLQPAPGSTVGMTNVEAAETLAAAPSVWSSRPPRSASAGSASLPPRAAVSQPAAPPVRASSQQAQRPARERSALRALTERLTLSSECYSSAATRAKEREEAERAAAEAERQMGKERAAVLRGAAPCERCATPAARSPRTRRSRERETRGGAGGDGRPETRSAAGGCGGGARAGHSSAVGAARCRNASSQLDNAARVLTRARPSRARRPAPRGHGQRSNRQPRGRKEETPAKRTARCNDWLHRAARAC